MGQLTLRAPSLGGFRRLSYLPNIRESLDLDFRSGLTFACEADGLISLCLTTHGTLEEFYHLFVDQGDKFFQNQF